MTPPNVPLPTERQVNAAMKRVQRSGRLVSEGGSSSTRASASAHGRDVEVILGALMDLRQGVREEHYWKRADLAMAALQRLDHERWDLTHCGFTVAENQGRPSQRLYRCTLWPKGHQGDHHRIGDSHMEEADSSWSDYLGWKEANS